MRSSKKLKQNIQQQKSYRVCKVEKLVEEIFFELVGHPTYENFFR